MTKLTSNLPNNCCPDQSDLKDFHFGNIAECKLDAIAAHLEHCTACEQYLLQIDQSADEAIAALRIDEKFENQLSRPALTKGQRIADYEVIDEIGHGGMGLVCKARHVALNRIVALKMLLAGELANAECRSRFAAEAEAMARLQHSNIVQIYEIGTWKRSDGCTIPFLALEYVSGGNLSEHTRGRPQPPAIAAKWIETLALAVHHAHEHGVIHRDLKPSNILFDSDGQLKLCDFGVAKLITGAELHTRTGILVGTPEYMAPEQAGEGQPIGAAADIWALGAILYNLLTGSPPFVDADTIALLQKIRLVDPVSPRLLQGAVVRDLDTVCMKCLQKDVSRRYASAAELAEDLGRIRQGQPILARPVSVLEQSWKWSKRRPAAATTIAWLFLLATIGLPIVTWLWLRSESARLRADENVEQAESALYFNRIALARQGLESEGIDQTLSMLERCNPAKNARDRRNWEWRYLNRQARLGHRDGLNHEQVGEVWTWINAIDWSPDGRRLASVGGPVAQMTPGKLRIWDCSTWQCQVDREQPGGTLYAVVWHPTKPLLMVGSADGKVYQWDTDGYAASQPFWQSPAKDDSVRHLRFSPDEKLLAIGTTTGLYLYDLDTQCDCLVQSAEWPGVASIDFQSEVDDFGVPSTHLLATFSGRSHDGQLTIWDVTRWTSINRLTSHKPISLLACGAFARGLPNLPIAIAERRSNDVEIWSKDASIFLDRLRGHQSGLMDLKFSDNGKMATAGEDGTVRVWDIANRVEKAVFRGHADVVRKISFNPEGTKLASCGQDLRICIWDVDQDPRGIHFQATRKGGGEYAGGLAFSAADNALVFVSQLSQSVSHHNVTNGEILSSLELPLIKSFSYARRDQALRTDASQLASSDPLHPEVLKIWDVLDGKSKTNLTHDSKPVCVAWSDDGSVLVTTVEKTSPIGQQAAATVDTLVRVWNPQTGEKLNDWVIANERVTGLSVDKRGELVATSIGEMPTGSGPMSPSHVVVWETRSGRLRHQLHGCEGLIPALCFRPDSLQLAAAGLESQMIYSWELDGSNDLLKRQALATPTNITYSPDGQRIAVGCYDNRVRIWDSQTANEAISLLCLGTPGSGSYAFKSWVAFSADGRRLAASDWQGCVTVWDAPFLRLTKILKSPVTPRASSLVGSQSRLRRNLPAILAIQTTKSGNRQMALKIQYRDSNGGYADVPVGRLYVLNGPNALQLRAVSTLANPNYALCNWSTGVHGQTANVNVNVNSNADTDAAATTLTATLGNESATVRVIVYSVTETVTPVRNSPVPRTNPISLGVAERVNLGFTTTPAGLSAATVGGLRWSLTGLAQHNRQGVLKAAATGNSLPNVSGTAYYIAPYSTDDAHESIPLVKTKTVQLNLMVDSGPSAKQLAVQKNIVVHTPTAEMVARGGGGIHIQNRISAGFVADIYMNPNSVNFEALEFREAGGTWTTHTGTFSQSHLNATGGPNVHQPTTFGTNGLPVRIYRNRNHVGDANTRDTVYTLGVLAVAPTTHVGRGIWRIYWQYRVAGTGTWIRFQIADHDVQSDASGRCTQSKAGQSISYNLTDGTTARATALGF